MTIYDDPFDQASNPQAPIFDYFGEIMLDVFFCVLEKGIGKVPFNPGFHSQAKRCTAVKIEVVPLAEIDLDFQILREMIAESKEYREIVWASLRDLGVTNLREINGKFAQVTTEPTGRKYTNQNNEEKEATTFKFLKLFDTIEECRLAYNGGASAVPRQVAQQAPLPTVDNTPASDGEKAIAEKFMRVVINNAANGQTDPAVIMQTVTANVDPNPLLKKYFGDVNSPEVMSMIAGAMAG